MDLIWCFLHLDTFEPLQNIKSALSEPILPPLPKQQLMNVFLFFLNFL